MIIQRKHISVGTPLLTRTGSNLIVRARLNGLGEPLRGETLGSMSEEQRFAECTFYQSVRLFQLSLITVHAFGGRGSPFVGPPSRTE
jgi:hypothetical protein